MTEHEKSAEFETYWIRPLQDMALEQRMIEEVGDPQSAAIANAMGVHLSKNSKNGRERVRQVVQRNTKGTRLADVQRCV